jgi:DNA topoisomerase IA
MRVSSDKKTLVAELKKLAKEAETVWLATDEDREGEAISWHLFETLGLKENQTKRITFNEITKTAVQRAIENPRTINKELVDAHSKQDVYSIDWLVLNFLLYLEKSQTFIVCRTRAICSGAINCGARTGSSKVCY